MLIQNTLPTIKSFWQPVSANSIVVNREVETFTVECFKEEVVDDYRFSIYPWKERRKQTRVYVELNDLEEARKLIKRVQSAGFIALRNWIE